MKKVVLALCAMGSVTLATPAYATVEVSAPTSVGCATGPLAPPADTCAGYYSNNQFSNANVGAQQSAIDLLLGYLRRHDYTIFVIYRLVLAALIVIVIASGWRGAHF